MDKTQILAFRKEAGTLKIGDEILSSRLTIVEIAKIEKSEWKGKQSVHLTFIMDQGTACFYADEEVLALESGFE